MFLIIPVGHESSTVRRQPWVSFGIIILCSVLYFFFTDKGMTPMEMGTRVQKIVEYALEHPYTEIDPEVKKLIDLMFGSAYWKEVEQVRENLRESKDKPLGYEIEEQQAQLDEMTGAFLERYQDNSFQEWGYIPSREGHLYTLVTNIFFHGGFFHLFGNMLFFFLCGPFIEDRWGRGIFLFFYLASGVLATLTHAALTDTPDIPLVGASGAIAGAMGAFLVMFFRTKIRFLYIIFILRIFRGFFHVPAYIVLPFWFGQQMYYALRADGSPVAFWAHVGGFAFGAGFALLMRYLKVEERFISPDIEKQITFFEAHPLSDKALELRNEGRFEEAAGVLEQILKERPNDINAMYSLFDVRLESNDEEGFQKIGSRLVMALLKEQQIEEATEVYDNMRVYTRKIQPAPEVLFNLASAHERSGDKDLALRIFESLFHSNPRHVMSFRALIRAARLQVELYQNYKVAFECYVRAKHHPKCDPAMTQQIATGIMEARMRGGPMVEAMKEEDVSGLSAYREPEPGARIEIKTKMSDLLGLSPQGIRLRDESGKQHTCAWNQILLFSTAVVTVNSAGKQTGRRSAILIDLYVRQQQREDSKYYLGFRLRSDRIPLAKIFKDNPDVNKALKMLLQFFFKNIVNDTIPPKDALSRFDLPRYDSEEDYESGIKKLIGTNAGG